ncbi:integrase, partial [Halobacteriales archaeon SW_12_71_31]
HVARVVQDYIDGPRPSVSDRYDRVPLFASQYGRMARSTVRDVFYRVTRPCWLGRECPHDRDPDECEAAEMKGASKCPSSRAPHDARSGRVTYYRRNDTPRRIVKDRLDASEDILDEHYDRRGEREKSNQRYDYLPDS